jgi:hypothetical protein
MKNVHKLYSIGVIGLNGNLYAVGGDNGMSNLSTVRALITLHIHFVLIF